MNRIDSTFYSLRTQKKGGLIIFITAGDPDLETTKQLVLSIAKKNVVDIIELGVPFSDPIADGPTIQKSSQRALAKKTYLKDILQLCKELRTQFDVKIPIALMTYYNPIYRYGINNFVSDAINSGVDGVIIPDLPPEEASELINASRNCDLATIFLLAPTSTYERIRKITEASTGFIYYVSLTGVTGAREKITSELKDTISRIRKFTEKPIAVGFGISKPEHVKEVIKAGADAAIVGSAIVDTIEKNLATDRQILIDKVIEKIVELASPLDTTI